MSQKDRDRLKVLHEVEKGQLTQKQAGMQLKLSERWVRDLLSVWGRRETEGFCIGCGGGHRSGVLPRRYGRKRCGW